VPIAIKIESGVRTGEAVPLEPGKKVRVGRTDASEVAIAEDNFLSRTHFEVELDGEVCRLRDLKSNNGTQVNGVRVRPEAECVVKDGDLIAAGGTFFRICGSAEAVLEYERLLGAMRKNLQPLYAVINAAQEPSILRLLRESDASPQSLFDGEAMYRLVHFAPYLLALPPESKLLPLLVRQGWGKNWGVYLTSTAQPWELLAFLKRLLTTQFPSGQRALLRYYDPRVLRTLMVSSTPQQVRHLFGPVRVFLMEGETPEVAVGFSLTPNGLDRTEVALIGDAPPKTARVELGVGVAGVFVPSMFVPSEVQMEELEKQRQDSFLEDLLVEMKKQFPTKFAGEGAAERMREEVAYGCKRPPRYGIRSQGDIRRYVRLMMQLGRDFDVDPALPWAADLLVRRLPPGEKLNRLEGGAAAVK
jgi:hypothetical protein